MGLFGLEYDTLALVNGTLAIKSIGADSAGKEMWSATTHVLVANGESGVPNTPTANPALLKPATDPKPTPTPTKAKPVPSTPVPLAKTYSNAKYGFWMSIPAGWVIKDKTSAMKPVQAGNGWVEFTSPKAAGLVVNVKRTRVSAGTTPETFAKFNPYVATWDRKSILGVEGFSTNTDTGNKIIHRLIFIKNGLVWMLNCVDANGKLSTNGQGIFDSIVASFGVGAAPKSARVSSTKPAPKVTVTPLTKTGKAAVKH
jgi:hypothetical protein